MIYRFKVNHFENEPLEYFMKMWNSQAQNLKKAFHHLVLNPIMAIANYFELLMISYDSFTNIERFIKTCFASELNHHNAALTNPKQNVRLSIPHLIYI